MAFARGVGFFEASQLFVFCACFGGVEEKNDQFLLLYLLTVQGGATWENAGVRDYI